MDLRPYGVDTIVIPFTIEGAGAAPVVARMSRLRPRGMAYRGGVASSPGAGEGGNIDLVQFATAAPIPFLRPSVHARTEIK